LDAVPFAGVTVTETRLDLPSRGTRTEIRVVLQEETDAVTVPNLTTPACPRPVPEIVIRSPDCALLSDSRVMIADDGTGGVVGGIVVGGVVGGIVVGGVVGLGETVITRVTAALVPLALVAVCETV